MCNRFDSIRACDRQTDGRTDRQLDTRTSCDGIVRAMHTRRAVKTTKKPMNIIKSKNIFKKFVKQSQDSDTVPELSYRQQIARQRRTQYVEGSMITP